MDGIFDPLSENIGLKNAKLEDSGIAQNQEAAKPSYKALDRDTIPDVPLPDPNEGAEFPKTKLPCIERRNTRHTEWMANNGEKGARPLVTSSRPG